MSHRDSLAERIRRGEPLSPALDLALRALTPIQRLGMALRLRRKPVRVDAHVISVGNLTAGGTGKTPAVIAIAELARAHGQKVAVLTRGYGSEHSPEPIILPGFTHDHRLVKQFGDEAFLIACKAGVPVVKDHDRVRGARHAIKELGANLLILDDGFQYTRLARDEDILLIDAANPFGNGHLLPRGILREKPEAANRATAIVLTHSNQADNVWKVAADVQKLNPHAELVFTRHATKSIWRVADGKILPVDTLRERKVDAACAIAVPDRFFAQLEAMGAIIVNRHIYRDHMTFPIPEQKGERWLIVTEKDAARMDDPPNTSTHWASLLRNTPQNQRAERSKESQGAAALPIPNIVMGGSAWTLPSTSSLGTRA